MKNIKLCLFALISCVTLFLLSCENRIPPKDIPENKVYTRIKKPTFGGDWFFVQNRMGANEIPYMRMSLYENLFNEGRVDFIENGSRIREEKMRFDCDLPNWERERPSHEPGYPIYPVFLNFDEDIIYASKPTYPGFRFDLMPTYFGIYWGGQWSGYTFTNSTTQKIEKYQRLKPGTLNDLSFTYDLYDLYNIYSIQFTFDVNTKTYVPQ